MIEWIVFVSVFGAVCGAYALGRAGSDRLMPSARGLHQLRQYAPPVDVVLEYRNEAGLRISRRVAVLRSLRHHDGRLYLFGFCGGRDKPRMFRVDRIISVMTADGEIIDLRRFLTDRLAIPPRLCATRDSLLSCSS